MAQLPLVCVGHALEDFEIGFAALRRGTFFPVSHAALSEVLLGEHSIVMQFRGHHLVSTTAADQRARKSYSIPRRLQNIERRLGFARRSGDQQHEKTPHLVDVNDAGALDRALPCGGLHVGIGRAEIEVRIAAVLVAVLLQPAC